MEANPKQVPGESLPRKAAVVLATIALVGYGVVMASESVFTFVEQTRDLIGG